jgi:hypothetical protein
VHCSALSGFAAGYEKALADCSIWSKQKHFNGLSGDKVSRVMSASFGSASARFRGTKEAANPSYDLRCFLSSPIPEVPFHLAERILASPFLTSPTKF